jgi:hypothetical protein
VWFLSLFDFLNVIVLWLPLVERCSVCAENASVLHIHNRYGYAAGALLEEDGAVAIITCNVLVVFACEPELHNHIVFCVPSCICVSSPFVPHFTN